MATGQTTPKRAFERFFESKVTSFTIYLLGSFIFFYAISTQIWDFLPTLGNPLLNGLMFGAVAAQFPIISFFLLTEGEMGIVLEGEEGDYFNGLLIGLFERTMAVILVFYCTPSLSAIFGGWLVAKVASEWHRQSARRMSLALIGNAMSLSFGVLGGLIARGRLDDLLLKALQ